MIRCREKVGQFSEKKKSDFFKLWKNVKNCKSRENNIINYYVLIIQFQQLSPYGQFVPSVPHLLDYFEANYKQHIISPINMYL